MNELAQTLPQRLRRRVDRLGVLLSALCMVHCVAGVLLVALLGLGGSVLLDPRIHEYGLVAAVVVGALGLGTGFARHGDKGPLLVGGLGLTFMTGGVFAPHGLIEAGLTVAGVSLLAAAHIRNLRHTH